MFTLLGELSGETVTQRLRENDAVGLVACEENGAGQEGSLEASWAKTSQGDRVAGRGPYRRIVDSLASAALAGNRQAATSFACASLSPYFALEDDSVDVLLGLMAEREGSDPISAFALGRVGERLGRPAEALRAYRAVVEHAGFTVPALLGEARMLAALGDSTLAVARYWDAVRGAEAAGEWEPVRVDLLSVADPYPADDADPAAVPMPQPLSEETIRRFWNALGLGSGWTGEQRLREHLRRRAEARVRYHLPATARRFRLTNRAWLLETEADRLPLLSTRRSDFEGEFAGMRVELGPEADRPGTMAALRRRGPDADPWIDDRGAIYVRHGEPHRRVNYPGVSGLEAESWLYAFDDWVLILHFAGRIGDAVAQPTTLVATPAGDYMAACQIDARFCNYEARRAAGRDLRYDRERLRARGREHAALARRTSTQARVYRHALDAGVRVHGLLDAEGRPHLVAQWAVAMPQATTGSHVPLTTSILGLDAESGAEVSTTRTWQLPTAADLSSRGQQAASGLLTMPASGAMYDVSVVMETGSEAGSVALARGIPLPNPRSDTLAAGGLIVGPVSGGMEWRGPDAVIRLGGGRAFSRSDTLLASLQATGLQVGTDYQLSVGVEDEKGARQLSLQGRHVATRSVETISLTLDPSELRGGTYLVRLTVMNPGSGAVLERWAEVAIEP